MSEYFVRAPGSENADGPFTLQQLRELAASEIIRSDTLVFEEGMEDFEPIGEKASLWEDVRVRPKQGLKLRKKPGTSGAEAETTAPETARKAKKSPKVDVPSTQPVARPTDESGDIDRMLAAAEGKTEQTRHVRRMKKSRERAVALLLPGLVLMLLCSVASIIQPFWEEIFEMFRSADYSFDLLFGNWILVIAVLDLVLAIGIGLGQTGLFALLRFRAALGLGFFVYLFYSRGEPEAMGASAALQIGLLGATLCARFGSTLILVLLGLGGGGFLVWLAWFKGIAL